MPNQQLNGDFMREDELLFDWEPTLIEKKRALEAQQPATEQKTPHLVEQAPRRSLFKSLMGSSNEASDE
jgi:hypothetical protein